MPRIPARRVWHKPPNRPIWAPIVNVTIDLYGCDIAVAGRIDSGADRTMVPFEALSGCIDSFDAIPGTTARGEGAGGTFSIRFVPALAWFRAWHFADEVAVAEPGALTEVLLGREDFFVRFSVSFAWAAKPRPYVDIEPAVVPLLLPGR